MKHYLNSQNMLVFLMIYTPFIMADTQSVEINIEIHPAIEEKACGRLPSSKVLKNEEDFPKVIKNGWVRLRSHTYQSSRQFYPCMQNISVIFPSVVDYYEYVQEMSACPQYPFYSGADYELQTAIFKRTAKLGDVEAYNILLKRDGRCASELNAPLFSILRNNPKMFLSTFYDLTHNMKKVVAATQYDFNIEIKKQQFSPETLSSLESKLQEAAIEFNTLIASYEAR